MSQVVLLDAGVIGLLTNPNRTPNNVACARWLQAIAMARIRVIVPPLVHEEVRRERLQTQKNQWL